MGRVLLLVVHCCGARGNELRRVDDFDTVDPIVVVKVLSPTTMDVDCGPKLEFYKTLPTLRHIVLAYQDQTRVEHYFRTDAGWERQVLTRSTDRLELAAVEFEIGMERIYFGVPL